MSSRGWRERLLGGPRRLGYWTLPLFVAVGLLGATLAGALATVYYAGQVSALREETAEARRDLAAAAEQVSEAAQEAVATIESEASALRDEFAVSPPLGDAAAAGLVSVRSVATVVEEQEPPPPAGPGATERPPPPPPEVRTVERLGSGFAVVVASGSAFFVTTYAVVVDPERPDVPVEAAEVAIGGRTVEAAVHSWDPARDLALLRVDGLTRVPVLEWRPAEEVVAPGGNLFATGLLPTGTLAQFGTTVGAVDAEAIVTDSTVPDVLRGGPLVDARGRVVGVLSTAYAPFGEGGTTNPAVPIRILCESLIRCGADDLPEG